MTHFILSPCLIKTNEDNYNTSMNALENYHNILDFSKKWLALKLLIHENSIFFNLNGYAPPLEEQTLASFFQTNIAPIWYDLLSNGDIVCNNENGESEIQKDYTCVDKTEWNLLCNCLKALEDEEALMFVCDDNNVNERCICVNKKYKLHTVSNPLTEETEIFNEYLNYPGSSIESLFPCDDICKYFVDKSKKEGESSAYRKYGDIIAKRNGFVKLSYDSKRYKPNVPAYKSKNEEFFISLDEKHGSFEVFAAKKHNAPFIDEYGFDGKKILQKKSNAETHKFYR